MHQTALALSAEGLTRSKPAFETVSMVTEKIENDHEFEYGFELMVPGTGLEPVWLAPRDFKSLVYTNFTTRAVDLSMRFCIGVRPRTMRAPANRANPDGRV